LGEGQKADYPDELQQAFGDKRSHPLNPPTYMDYKGCELFLTARKV
jgi:hypothetical protein